MLSQHEIKLLIKVDISVDSRACLWAGIDHSKNDKLRGCENLYLVLQYAHSLGHDLVSQETELLKLSHNREKLFRFHILN
jgi:hypothetical protein